jgi:hypothetical protein
MLLSFVVSERDIEAYLEKISAITDMGPIKNLKGVQRVAGYLAALSRFIARLGERSLQLYYLMKKSDHFAWGGGPPRGGGGGGAGVASRWRRGWKGTGRREVESEKKTWWLWFSRGTEFETTQWREVG